MRKTLKEAYRHRKLVELQARAHLIREARLLTEGFDGSEIDSLENAMKQIADAFSGTKGGVPRAISDALGKVKEILDVAEQSIISHEKKAGVSAASDIAGRAIEKLSAKVAGKLTGTMSFVTALLAGLKKLPDIMKKIDPAITEAMTLELINEKSDDDAPSLSQLAQQSKSGKKEAPKPPRPKKDREEVTAADATPSHDSADLTRIDSVEGKIGNNPKAMKQLKSAIAAAFQPKGLLPFVNKLFKGDATPFLDDEALVDELVGNYMPQELAAVGKKIAAVNTPIEIEDIKATAKRAQEKPAEKPKPVEKSTSNKLSGEKPETSLPKGVRQKLSAAWQDFVDSKRDKSAFVQSIVTNA